MKTDRAKRNDALRVSAADAQAALDQIAALAGNVDVSGAGSTGDPFVITFTGALANTAVSLLQGDFSGLTVASSYAPSTASVSMLNVGGGGFSQQQVVGYIATGGLPITQGNFVLAFNGQTTGNIAYNATAAQVQTALQGLSTIGAGNVTVTGGADAGTGADLYTFQFTGALAGDAGLPSIAIQSAATGGLADSNGQTTDVALESYLIPAAAQPAGAAEQLVVTATSGTVSLSFEGETTAPIDVPATAASVEGALAALPLIGSGNVQVIGSGTWASPFLVVFVGDLAGQALPALTEADSLSTVNTVTTTYNADSQISTIGDNYSHYAYTYDGQGNTATVDNSGTPGVPDVVLTSQYDSMGNRTGLSATVGGVKDFVNNYSYDALSRLYDVVQQNQSGGNAVAPKQVYYKLDGIGDVTEIDRSTSVTVGPNPNGFANSVLTYWPTTGQLKEINHESGTASLDDLTYTYDGVGRVATFGSIDGTATYGYDPMSQLTSATYTTAAGGHQPANESYSFDTNGNRPAENGTTTTDNEVPDDGTFHYTFDGAGNRLTRTRDSSASANDYNLSYTWDTANRLVEVQDFNNAGTLTEQLNYTYDVFNHLIARVDDIISGATTTSHYIWDDNSALPSVGNALSSVPPVDGGIVLALDGNGNVVNRYLNGPNTNAYDQFFSTLAEENDTASPAVVTWDLLDAESTLRDVISSTGAVLDHLNYNSFGRVTYESAPTVSHIDGYAGGLYDPSTALVYFIHRWYDPQTTVWISADPAGFAGGDLNETRYVANYVTGAIDPSGLVLIAVDGTGSKAWRSKSSPNPGDPYQSHVRNFYEDYKRKPGETKLYWDGPDSTINGAADECQKIFNGVMSRLKRILRANPNEDINLIGHSRGGYIVMQVAWELKRQGYRVNFLGLYDAVDSAPGFGTSEKVPSNVNSCAHAISHWAARSRAYFNRADHGAENSNKMKQYAEKDFVGTHAAIGGAPWAGDHPRGMTPRLDGIASVQTDNWMREQAQKAGIKLDDPE